MRQIAAHQYKSAREDANAASGGPRPHGFCRTNHDATPLPRSASGSEATLIPFPSSAAEAASSSTRSPPARHAAPSRDLLLPPVLSPPLAVASLQRGGGGDVREVRGLLLYPVAVIGGGGAAGGEGAQLRDGGLRAARASAVGHPLPAHRRGARRAARGAHARGLGRGRAPP